jgi:hypothetical protein
MNTVLSLTHAGAGLLSVLVAIAIFRLPKGSARHRQLGWIYVVSLGVSLIGIMIRTAGHIAPFMLYAFLTAGVLLGAVVIVRVRTLSTVWRAWHAGLMSWTVMASAMAMFSIVGGVIVGAGNGPVFYRMFNIVVIATAAAGLAIISRRPVIWGRPVGPAERSARLRYSALVAASAVFLVIAQWPLAMGV